MAKACSVSGAPMRASRLARRAGPSKPDGSGYFFTAWRCTNRRLQAWIGSSASVSCVSAVGFRLDLEEFGDEAVQVWAQSHDQVGFFAAVGRPGVQHVLSAGADAGRDPAAASAVQEQLIQPDQPVAGGQISEGEAKAQARNVGNSHRIGPLFIQGVWLRCHRWEGQARLGRCPKPRQRPAALGTL